MDRYIDPGLYDERYYLTSCEGHQEYMQVSEKTISPRLRKTMDLAKIQRGMKILDIGCGRGEITKYSALKGANAVGIDYSKAAISIKRSSKELSNDKTPEKISLLISDAKKLPFKKNTFDRVFFIDIIEHLYPEEVEEAFSEIKRVLKSDGILLVHTAPNLWVHKYTYPVFRLIMVIFFRRKMPGKLDNFGEYTATLHINKQSVLSLRKTLSKFGFKSNVWLEDPNPYGKVLRSNKEELNIIKRKIVWLLRSYFPFKLIFCNHIFGVARK